MRPRGLTLRMVAASGLLVAVVAVVFSVLLSAIGDLRGSTRLTEHSVSVLAASSELQNQLGDFSTATRNYVDAPSPAALEHWGAQSAPLPGAAAGLRTLVRDTASQTAAAATLAGDIESYRTAYAAPLMKLA